MHYCSHVKALIVKANKFSKSQCSQYDSKMTQMQRVSYLSIVGSLMYDRVYTRLDITYVVGVLERYLSVLELAHCKVI